MNKNSCRDGVFARKETILFKTLGLRLGTPTPAGFGGTGGTQIKKHVLAVCVWKDCMRFSLPRAPLVWTGIGFHSFDHRFCVSPTALRLSLSRPHLCSPPPPSNGHGYGSFDHWTGIELHRRHPPQLHRCHPLLPPSPTTSRSTTISEHLLRPLDRDWT